MNSKGFLSKKLLPLSGFALLGFMQYLPALALGFVNWDDPGNVYENPYINTPSIGFALWAAKSTYFYNWHPLTWLSYSVDYMIWGLDPFGYHLTNVLLHAISTALVFVVAIRLWAAARGGANRVPGPPMWQASAVAVLFAVHPLHVESVAWVSERKDVLFGMFYLLSLALYLSYVNSSGGRRRALYWVSTLSFACALMSKQMAVTLPLVLVLIDAWPLGRIHNTGQFIKRAVVEKLPHYLMALGAGLMALRAHAPSIQESTLLPPLARAALVVRSYAFYLFKAVFPLGLSPFYTLDHVPGFADPQVMLGAALVLAVTAYGAYRAYRGAPGALVLWLAYIVMLLPVAGFLQVGGSAGADRYMYLPLIVPAIGAVALAERLSTRYPGLRRKLLTFGVVCVIALSSATVALERHWRDSFTLWGRVMQINPQESIAYSGRGGAYMDQGDYARALEDFTKAIEIDLGGKGLTKLPQHYLNQGRALTELKRYGEATASIREALRLDPNYTEAMLALGENYALSGQSGPAIELLQKAVSLTDGGYSALASLSMAYERAGRFDEALDAIGRAMAAAPGNMTLARLHMRRANIYLQSGGHDDALINLRQATFLDPGLSEAYEKMGNLYMFRREVLRAAEAYNFAIKTAPAPDFGLYMRLGGASFATSYFEEALAAYQAASAIEPGNYEPYFNAGMALAEMRRLNEAVAMFRKALELSPGFSPAYNNMAIAYAQMNRLDDAVAAFGRAIELEPARADYYYNRGRMLDELGRKAEADAAFAKSASLGDEPSRELLRNRK